MGESRATGEDSPLTILASAGIEMFDEDAIENWPKSVDEPELVAFLAPWCEVCLAAAPAFAALPGKLDGRAPLRAVDTDRHPQAAERMNVRSVPVLVLFARGREIARRTEMAAAEDLKGFVERALKDVPPPEVKKKEPGKDGPKDGKAGEKRADVKKDELKKDDGAAETDASGAAGTEQG